MGKPEIRGIRSPLIIVRKRVKIRKKLTVLDIGFRIMKMYRKFLGDYYNSIFLINSDKLIYYQKFILKIYRGI